MSVPRYSFLDLTVLPELRRKVLADEATILFAADMTSVLWANAPGAALFGGEELAELIGQHLGANQPFVRQLHDATQQIEGDEAMVRGFRVARGLKTEFIQCELSRIDLPGGEKGVLLACTEDRYAKPAREHDLAENAVQSLAGLASAAAIVDEYGLAIAATDSFANVDLSPDDVRALVAEAAREPDRLVKRAEELDDGRVIAIGVARLGDEPGRYLLVCADAGQEETEEAGLAGEETPAEAAVAPGGVEKEWPGEAGSEEEAPPAQAAVPEAEAVALGAPAHELVPPEGWEAEEPEAAGEVPSEPEAPSAEEAGLETGPEEETEEAGETEPVVGTARRQPSLLDRWYLGLTDEAGYGAVSARPGEPAQEPADEEEVTPAVSNEASTVAGHREEEGEPAKAEMPEAALAEEQPAEPTGEATAEMAEAEAAAPEEKAAFAFAYGGEPVRFAWIIDADQTFRSVSPELGQAVGPNAADIVGRKWADVAAVFGFDAGGEIHRLLERRDTWSGKSVLWPVQGTDLAVPIDLAALPAFDALRQFDGFRGFGIIRTSDAVIDPNETGLALVPGGKGDEGRAGKGASAGAEAADEDSEHRILASRIDEEEPKESSTGARSEGPPANVVHLPSRQRLEQLDELSRRESQAFSEIGRALRGSQNEGRGGEGAAAGETGAAKLHEPAGDIASPDAGTEEQPAERESETAGEAKKAPGGEVTRKEGEAAMPRRITTEILEQLPVPVLVYRNGATLFANPELLQLTGYETVDDLSAAGGVDALLSGRIEEDGQSRATLTTRDGRKMDISPLLKTVPWNDEMGDAGKALLLSFRHEEARQPSQDKIALDMARVAELQNILDTATDGIIIANADGMIESLNASAEALFGIDFDPSVEYRLADFFAQESHKVLADYLAELSQPGVGFVLNDGREVIGKEAKGGLIPLFITIGPVGAAEKFCVVLRDMTHWKKVEEELVNAKRAAELASEQKSDFLARVSHEIRTPLNAIIGFSDVMLEERFGPIGNDRYREYLRDINRSGIHVLDLINDLLDISKIEAGKMELSYEAVDLNQLVAETVALLQPQANRERIIIRTSLSRAVPRVVADARSIRQIILNLVSNAIKFTPENGQVIVSTVYEGNGEVALRVRDTGKGMSEAEIDNAMKPFQQLSGIDEKRGQGTGLGLPLTKALVEANRAYFDLESTPGDGTIAHVHFPIQRVLAD